ncbi:MAG TPA: FKBP-type peptidyl-prolyl cis-trans isomerase, partial [Sphingomonas sp.]
PGFSEALKLMSKGAKYQVWIPAKLGYGDKGAGPIPANSTLVFDIELVDFLPQSVIEQYQRQMQMMNGGGAGGMGGPGGPGGAGGPPPGGGESLVPPPGQ